MSTSGPPESGSATGINRAASIRLLRHAHASPALDSGAPITLVAATLGHADVKTTAAKTKFQLGVSSMVFSVVHPMWKRGREAFSCSATRQRPMYRWGRNQVYWTPARYAPARWRKWRAIMGCQSGGRRSRKKVRRLWQHPATANQLSVWLVAAPRAKCSTPRRGSVKRLGPYS